MPLDDYKPFLFLVFGGTFMTTGSLALVIYGYVALTPYLGVGAFFVFLGILFSLFYLLACFGSRTQQTPEINWNGKPPAERVGLYAEEIKRRMR